MFSYEPILEPSIDYFTEYAIPQRIEEVCQDIILKGSSTKYNSVYDAIYELVEEALTEEASEGGYVY